MRAEPAFRRFGFREFETNQQAFNGHTFTVVRMTKRLDRPLPGEANRPSPVTGFPPTPSLHNPRVWLEPLRVGHADELASLLDDPALHTFIGGRPATLTELRARYRHQLVGHSPNRAQRWLNWTVRHRPDSRALGTVQATVTNNAAGVTAEMAWTIAVAHQGQGYASEAADVMVQWLRRHGVGRFVAHIHPDHEASQRVARKIGLSPTAVIRDGETRWEA